MTSVVIIGEVRFLRDGVAAAIEASDPGLRVTAGGFADAPRLLARAADLLVVELDEGSAPQLAQLRRHAETTPMLGLVLAAGPSVVVGAAALGVRAFVSRAQPLADVVAAARRARRGEAVCPQAVAAVLFEHLSAGRVLRDEIELTAREREVGALLARGLSNKEIALALVTSPATVKNHVHSILQKLQVRRRGEAAALLR